MSVRLEMRGPRADLTLDRPQVLNAMDLELFDALADAARKLEGEPEVRVVVVRAEGRSFSSGIDVSALGNVSAPMEEMVARAQAGFRALHALPMPTIASVQGHALGAGLQLALACDLRVVAADARLGLLEIRYGLIPDLGGSNLLPHLVGPSRAKKMIWLGEIVGGADAGAIGLADMVVAADELASATDQLAARLAAAPSTPVREVKALIDGARLRSLAGGMDAEGAAQIRCLTDPSFGAALAAGLARR